MKTGAQPSKPRSNYALFLGDLSIFCDEKDIEETFQQYGEIVNIRIQRSKETSRALSYGFIEFSCETAAVTAMNELNGFVLKGRPLRIRWAAKRNQPVKSENTALQTAATIFVKFASQTGIIVSEAVLREHFSVFGKVLDTTIRTITIDETYNRSKGYGFVNFVNTPEEDGLAAAYRATAELQNTTVSGVNYRCEVGYKHQPQAQQGLSHARQMGRSDSDSVSAGGYSVNASGSVSGNVSVGNVSASMSTASRPGFLPAMSPKQMFSGNSVNSAGGLSVSPSHSSSGPSSPHPQAFFAMNPQVMSSGASVHSVGSGSTGMYSQNSPYAPHSPHHPVSAIVSTISFVPSGNNSVYSQHSQQSASQASQHQQQQGMYAQQGMPHSTYSPVPQQMPYYPAQQQYMPQQPQYYAPQQQGYYAPATGYAPQQQAQMAPQQQGYYAAPQQGYYGMPPQEYGAYYPAHQQAPQGYYAPAQQAVSMVPPAPGNHGQSPRRPPTAAAHEGSMHLTEQALHQHQGNGRSRRPSMGPGNYAVHPQAFAQAHQDAAPGPDARRSQRNISNKSNISEITSATLNELQGDDEDEEVLDAEDEEVQPPADSASFTAPNDASEYEATPDELAHALSSHLKSTLQTQPDTNTPPATINCKLTARRRRNVTGGSNTTEITAAVLYDLRQQEQRRDQEEEEEGFIEPPNAPRCTTPVESEVASPVKAVLFAPRARLTTTPEPFLPDIHVSGSSKSSEKSPPSARASRRKSASSAECAAVALPAKSISPFTLSASALARLQFESEATDAAIKVPQRRTKRNISDRSNASDITAALAFMQVEYSEDHFRSLDDDGESFSSAEVSACICGKASMSPGASSCPYGTTACSCVYSAMC